MGSGGILVYALSWTMLAQEGNTLESEGSAGSIGSCCCPSPGWPAIYPYGRGARARDVTAGSSMAKYMLSTPGEGEAGGWGAV